jgi:heme-degrading monooxygenase HmoA
MTKTPQTNNFRSLARFDVKPGMEAEFESAFKACGMLERPRLVPGMIAVQLVQSETTTTEYLVMGEWDSRESYASWQSQSFKGLDKSLIKRFLATLNDQKPGQLFIMRDQS